MPWPYLPPPQTDAPAAQLVLNVARANQRLTAAAQQAMRTQCSAHGSIPGAVQAARLVLDTTDPHDLVLVLARLIVMSAGDHTVIPAAPAPDISVPAPHIRSA